MIRALLLAAFLLASPVLSPQAWAISDPAEALPDPALERKAVAIGQTLRCLVCQNESIEDSGADLAKDLRKIVREHVARGEDGPEITAWLVARYGNFVRLRPPVNAGTAILWASPLIALVIAGLALFGLRRRTPPAPPLTEAERQRLAGLMEP